MIPIKIECGCGQRYAFDVEPVNGRMPSVVACPTCGVDGTHAANEILSRQIPVQPAASPIRLIESPNPIRQATPVIPAAAPALQAKAPTVIQPVAPATIQSANRSA